MIIDTCLIFLVMEVSSGMTSPQCHRDKQQIPAVPAATACAVLNMAFSEARCHRMSSDVTQLSSCSMFSWDQSRQSPSNAPDEDESTAMEKNMAMSGG